MSTQVPQKKHAYFDVCSIWDERMSTIKIDVIQWQFYAWPKALKRKQNRKLYTLLENTVPIYTQ